MSNKYKNAISKIEASEELKNTIIEKMEKEQAKTSGGIIIKTKKVISTIISLLGVMACGGVVFAAVSGILNINGILFSDEYTEYEQKVENQYLEKDGTKVELVSTICDDGFLVLQFEVELSNALADGENGGMAYLSFNDKLMHEEGETYLTFNGSNYNLLIDGEKYWLKGATNSQIIENVKNKNYTIYQLYFLPSDVVENKESFNVTLDNVVIAIVPDYGEFLEMDGSFEIEVSKEKALQNTTTITNENASVTYERLTNKIEKVSQTPMQTVIKTSSLLKDATVRNSTYLLAEDYIGDLTYKVYDQDNNELFVYSAITGYEYYWEDGTVKTISISEIGEGKEDFGYNRYIKEEYIVTEKNENIKSLRVEVYEENQYYERIRQIGTHYINLEKEEITCENKNNIIKGKENTSQTNDEKKIEDNKYFEIKIDEKYDHELTSCYYAGYDHIIYEEEDLEVYRLNTDLSEEDCDMIIYNVSLWNPEYMNQDFKIVLFKDKTLYDIYCREENSIYTPLESIIIEENDEYKLALFMISGVGKIQNIKEIIDTIKLKEETENTEGDYIVLYNGHKIDKVTGTCEWGYEENKIDNTKVYYNYRKGKYIGETVGINLEENILPIISISKKYEAVPREYETVNAIPEKLNFLNEDDIINAEINKIDLDGDGKEEYICCYTIEYKTGDYSDMYEYELLKSHIDILDSDYNKIGNLTHLESDSDAYLSLQDDVEYIDIDNDGVMEILIEIPGWEWTTLEIYKYNNNQLSGNLDSYNYASWRHGV